MTTALTTTPEPEFDPKKLTIREMSFIANEIMQSKMFPDIVSAHVAFVKMLAGAEMGITPFQSVAGMHVIQGKAVPGGGLLAAAVKGSSKYDYRVKEHTDKTCTIEFFQKYSDEPVSLGVSTFTIEDARKAGTKNLDKFPRNMLFNRAMSNGVKWYCPDATNGPVYVEGEIIEPGPVTNSPESPQTDAVTGDVDAGTDEPLAPEPMPPIMDVVKEAAKDAGITDFDDALEALEPDPITAPQRAKIFTVLSAGKGIRDRDAQKRIVKSSALSLFGIEIESTNDLSKEQASDLIAELEKADSDILKTFFGDEA